MTWLTRAELRRDAPSLKALSALLLGGAARDAGHGLVWSLFAEAPDARRDFIFREADVGRFLVLSNRHPTDRQGLWTLETKPYAPSFELGQRLGFALRANPARSVKTPGRSRGIRVDAVMHAKAKAGRKLDAEEIEAAALGWLYARESAMGVRFSRGTCSAGGYRLVQIPRVTGKPIRHAVVDFEGALEVADPAAISKALVEGVGKARAYGCGMLLLRPLPA